MTNNCHNVLLQYAITSWQYLKQGFRSIIVMNVLIDSWFSLTEGCLVVSKKNWVLDDGFKIGLKMLLNQLLYVALYLIAKTHI